MAQRMEVTLEFIALGFKIFAVVLGGSQIITEVVDVFFDKRDTF